VYLAPALDDLKNLPVNISVLKQCCRSGLFWSIMKIPVLFRAYFRQIKFPEKIRPKILLGQDPDPVKNRPDPQH
jgi:hypothetical protein